MKLVRLWRERQFKRAHPSLTGTHAERVCRGRECIIHAPTKHHMRSWPLVRRSKGCFQRQCVHNIGHPDPDQFKYWREAGLEGLGVHGCDSCCAGGDQ